MKKCLLIIFILLAFFLVSCDSETNTQKTIDNVPSEEKEVTNTKEVETPVITDKTETAPVVTEKTETPSPTIEPLSSVIVGLKDSVIKIEDKIDLEVTKVNEPNYSYKYDQNLIEIITSEDTDYVIGKEKGIADIYLVFNDEEILVSSIRIIDPLDLEIDIPSQMYYFSELVLDISNDLKVSVNKDYFTYDDETHTLSANGSFMGVSVIRIESLYFEDLYKEYTIETIWEIIDADHVLVDNRYCNNTTEVIIDNRRYRCGSTLFSTIKDALVQNSEIWVASTSETELTIDRDSITIIGYRDEKFNLKINVLENVCDLCIQQLNFTKDSKIIFNGGNKNIDLLGNYFIDTTINQTAWNATKSYTSGIIEFLNSDNNYYDNINIDGNYFRNIGDCAINISTVHNLVVRNNNFYDFSKDAVRVNNGIVRSECSWTIDNNIFENGVYSGVYFRTYASDTVDFYHTVNVTQNVFNNVGTNGGEYVAGILFRNYQEGCVYVNIRTNSFYNCDKCIFLRNNAILAHQENWTGFVGYNLFNTVPKYYYFNNLNNSDTFTLNPKQAILKDNVYLKNDLDIVPAESKIIGAAGLSYISYDKFNTFDYNYVSVPYLMIVGKEYEVNSWKASSESFNIDGNKFIPLKAGINKFFLGSDEFPVKCVQRIELVVRFINIALGEVGYEEMDANGNTGTSGNYTKYGEWYGINPGAWCAMFVSWCANQAGVSTSVIPKYASVQIGMDWYKNKGLFKYKEEYTPKAGDIMFMKSNGASHTGIVLYCDGVTLYTVEGNSSDKCALRKYSVDNAKITGYGTPQWSYYSPDGYDFSSGEVQDGSNFSTR